MPIPDLEKLTVDAYWIYNNYVGDSDSGFDRFILDILKVEPDEPLYENLQNDFDIALKYFNRKYWRNYKRLMEAGQVVDAEVLSGAALTLALLSLYSRYQDMDQTTLGTLLYDWSLGISEDIISNVMGKKSKHRNADALQEDIDSFFKLIIDKNYIEILYKDLQRGSIE